MKQDTKRLSIGIGLLLAVAAAAHAGTRTSIPVHVDSTYAFGSLASARSSADSLQYIECVRYGAPGVASVTCYARDATGKSAMCSTSDATMVAESRSIKGDSLVEFIWDSAGNCTGLVVRDSSQLAPKSP